MAEITGKAVQKGKGAVLCCHRQIKRLAMSEMTNIHESGLEPAQFLVQNIDPLPKGRALDVATGSGRNAIYLAKMGFKVEGVDLSPEAMNIALESALKAGVTIRTQVADLKGDYYIKKDAYDVIICFNYLQRSLRPQIKDGLRRGGGIRNLYY